MNIYCIRHQQQFQVVTKDYGAYECCLDCEVEKINRQVNMLSHAAARQIYNIKRFMDKEN